LKGIQFEESKKKLTCKENRSIAKPGWRKWFIRDELQGIRQG
jgi:hypothetical protein